MAETARARLSETKAERDHTVEPCAVSDANAIATSFLTATPRGGSVWNQVTVMRAMKRLGIAGR